MSSVSSNPDDVPDACISSLTDRIVGTILGTAVGDALGLPREGMSPRRALRIFGPAPLRHQLLPGGRGMCSDDTEHTCLVGQSLLLTPNDPHAFARNLAWRMRFWLYGMPAGIGRATLQSIIKLWLGWSPEHSGVNSAGNGPAMRSALIGACLHRDPAQLAAFVRASTRMTHRDPRAEDGALLVALSAAYAVHHSVDTFCARDLVDHLTQHTHQPEYRTAFRKMADHLERGASARELADSLGIAAGISGYICHTVPIAIYCWLRQPDDYRAAVTEVILLGGDSDTTAAITGGLAGALLGEAGVPDDWLAGIWEWPRSVAWMRQLALALGQRYSSRDPAHPHKSVALFWPGVSLRNWLFLQVVLIHGFRRLFPPF